MSPVEWACTPQGYLSETWLSSCVVRREGDRGCTALSCAVMNLTWNNKPAAMVELTDNVLCDIDIWIPGRSYCIVISVEVREQSQ
jgi:hypothetical protein